MAQVTVPNGPLHGTVRAAINANFVELYGRCIDAATDYGVKVDGSDATSGMQAAINAAVAQKLPLYLPAGTIKFSTLSISGPIRIIGRGEIYTTLQVIAGTNANAITFGKFIGRASLVGMTIDGAKSSNSTGHLLYLPTDDVNGYGWGPQLEDIILQNAAQSAIYAGTNRNFGHMVNVQVKRPSLHGLEMHSSSDWRAFNFTSGFCTESANSGIGLWIEEGADNVFTGGGFFVNDIGVKISGTNTSPNALIGCSIDTNYKQGLYVDSSGPVCQHRIIACRFTNNSLAGDGLYSDILLNNTQGTIIDDNVFRLGSQKVKYLVECTSPQGQVFFGPANSFDPSGGAQTPFATGIAGPVGSTGSTAHQLPTNRYARVLWGSGNIASAANAGVGGDRCNSGGQGALVVGVLNTGSGQGSLMAGTGAHDRGQRSVVFGGVSFAFSGDNQERNCLMSAITTNATPARATTDRAAASTTNTLNLPYNSQAIVFERITIMCINPSNGDTRIWKVTDMLAKRGASVSAITLSGATAADVYSSDASLATAAVAVTADTTNGGVAVTVTGIAATTLHWVVASRAIEAA
jgi:hypothetical protein